MNIKTNIKTNIKIHLAIMGLLVPGGLQARTLEPAPSLDAWITEIQGADLPAQTVPQRLLLLEGGVGDAEEKNFIADAVLLEKSSTLIFIDGPSARMSSKLNSAAAEKKLTSPKARAAALPGSTSANVVIANIGGKSPVLYFNDGQRLRKLVTVKAYSGDKSPDSILTWIYQCFGYDGIILGQKGSYVIVGGPAATLGREKIQALAIRGSDTQLALLDKKRSGISLLELEVSKGAYAIFKILALAKDAKDQSGLTVGTKLTIQREAAK